MTQDFAKPHKSPAEQQPGPPRWLWFVTGFVSGGFLTFLLMLWIFVPTAELETEASTKPVPEPNPAADEMEWEFYEIFPKSVVPVVEEYNEAGEKVVLDNSAWVLQVGSFQNPNDADQLRAELILMGMDVVIKKIDVEGVSWHRVIVGPFEQELERNRAQDTLAQAQISAIPLRIPR